VVRLVGVLFLGALLASCSQPSSGCDPSLLVLGPQRSWLNAPRTIFPVACPGTETLSVGDATGTVPITGASSDSSSLRVTVAGDEATVQAVSPGCSGGSVRLETARGCVTHTFEPSSLAPMYDWDSEVHSCGEGAHNLETDHPIHANFLSGGHAHACTSLGAMWASGLEVIDETFDPCTGVTNCTALRFDLISVDTPPGEGLTAVDTIVGPASIDVGLGSKTTACFHAPVPGSVITPYFILDDGWTYDAPSFVDVAMASTPFTSVPDCVVVMGRAAGTGMLTAHLRDASVAVPLTVH
jgi:hypothetical protein